MNTFKKYLSKRKKNFTILIIFIFVYLSVLKKINFVENTQNFIFFYILIPIVFTIMINFMIDAFSRNSSKGDP